MPSAVEPYFFGADTRKGKFGPDSGARLVNAYIQEAAPGSLWPFNVYCRPGLARFATIDTTGGWRGGIDVDGKGFVIVGQQVYRLSSGGSATSIGAFPGTALASMARNRRSFPHVAVCSEGQRYLITTAAGVDTIATIGDSDLGAANYVIFHAGYFVWTLPTGVFQTSAVDDGTAYDALDFATAEADPDGLIGACPRGSEIVLFGSRTIQFYANVPDASGFPYQPVLGTTVQLGCLAAHTIRSVAGVPIFVASDSTVRMLDGYSPQRISTHEVEQLIEALTVAEKADLRAWTFQKEGHSFYVLNAASWTMVCDLLNRAWFAWSSYGSERFNVEGMFEVGGKRIVGAYDQPILYSLSDTAHDDDGEALVWKIISGPFGTYPYREIVDELHCRMLPGVGLTSGAEAVTDPVAMLRTSDDDGESWSDEMTARVGKVGEKYTETSFTGLGASGEVGFRFEVGMSAAVSRALTGAAIRHQTLKP